MRRSAPAVLFGWASALSLLSGCSDPELDGPADELHSRLSVYIETKDATSVEAWLAQYHGEAPTQQMLYRFVSWGNANPEPMNRLLIELPPELRNKTSALLVFAAHDSDQKVLFSVPQAGHDDRSDR